MKVAVASLGCRLNQYDGEAIKASFLEKGVELAAFEEDADLYVVNTCAVTQTAEKKSRQLIRGLLRKNPQAKMVVTGCYATISPDELKAIDGVNHVFGSDQKGKIVDVLGMLEGHAVGCAAFGEPRYGREESGLNVVGLTSPSSFFMPKEIRRRTRAVLKVQDGCERYCAFCIVPFSRPYLLSKPMEEAVREAALLAQSGFKEVVVSGACVGAYGEDLEENVKCQIPHPKGEARLKEAANVKFNDQNGSGNARKTTLADLLKALCDVDGIERIRLSSLDPRDVNSSLADVFANSQKVCPHVHLSLQSGSTEILMKMNRGYTREEYIQKVRRFDGAVPDLAVTTDIIVGFPGEEEEHFQNTLSIVSEVGFSKVHIFRYSPRPGTASGKMDDSVPSEIKEERMRKLTELCHEKAQTFREKFIGKTLNVLVETFNEKEGICEGLTGNYIRVFFKGEKYLNGNLVPVLIESVSGEIVTGHATKI